VWVCADAHAPQRTAAAAETRPFYTTFLGFNLLGGSLRPLGHAFTPFSLLFSPLFDTFFPVLAPFYTFLAPFYAFLSPFYRFCQLYRFLNVFPLFGPFFTPFWNLFTAF